jgi:tol-pal system protein YbgF
MISPTQAHRTFLRRRLAVAAVALIALSATGPAFGQSDTRELMNRLQRLENEMQTLSREVYRGGGGAGTSGTLVGSAAPAGNVAAGFEVRLQRMESEMQTLTGRYEEAAYQVGQLRDQLTKMQTDIDFRLSRLEQGQAGGLSAAAPGQDGDKPVPAPGKAGKATDAQPQPAASTATESTSETLPTGSVQEQYDYAFNLLRQADYPNAEKAFAQFLKAHPDSPLASNAQYWMGETLYVRNKFKEAAVAFAEGYQKYPKSNKAPDSLLKLSLALSAMKANDDACAALGELTKNYKDAPATIKRRADQEKNRLKCS